jgi:acetyl-CoA synthetase
VWFPGGRLNFTDNCVDRHVDAGAARKPRSSGKATTAQSRTLTYAELAAESISRWQRAEGARRRGRGPRRHLPADVAGGGDCHAAPW